MSTRLTLSDDGVDDLFTFWQPSRPQEGALGTWREWLQRHFPSAVWAPMAARHIRLWEWIDAIEFGQPSDTQVEIWSRGGGKSSTAELGVTRIGHKLSRRFGLYVSGTQGQANKHVQSIGPRFERLEIGRAIGPYKNSLGWRVDLLRAANGFNLLALGLDAAARGLKLEDWRPDLIILDDVDERHDSEKIVAKKIETITESILPSGSARTAVLFIQNRIHKGSIATQLAERTADFLLDAKVHEEKAVNGLELAHEAQPDGTRRYRIVAGEPTWAGQDLETCEAQINKWGRAAFMREAQHDTAVQEDGLWQRDRDIDPFRIPMMTPERIAELGIYRIGVALDPNAITGNDEAGIIVGGIYKHHYTDDAGKTQSVIHGVVFADETEAGGPAKWAKRSVDAFKRWDADLLVAEQNNGGEMVEITIGTIKGAPRVHLVHASRGKQTRAEPVQKLYDDGRIHHAGVFVQLESEMCTWKPGDSVSPNRMDALVWLFTALILKPVSSAPRVYAASDIPPRPIQRAG